MKSFLVVGLEGSCTKYVSKLLAANLGIIKTGDEWDGHWCVENTMFSVTHRSLPHNHRDYFISEDYYKNFDQIIVVVRDLYCSFISKVAIHQNDPIRASQEHEMGRKILREILSKKSVEIYSYESAFVIGQTYNEKFLRSLGIKSTVQIQVQDINKKYIKEGVFEFLLSTKIE
jgi:hypothetical protein